jgi:2-polyprenyl-3-methyl-5-hydroxy-6-metoxy-1,4-benzoquinol methylase
MLSPHVNHITGLDISPEAVALAKRKAAQSGVNNVEFRCQSLSELKWDESYDAILCLSFLHHVPAPELPGLLRQVRSHLSPGGIFYAVDPNIHGIMRSIGRVVMRGRYDDYHSPGERELDPAEIVSVLREAGFHEVRISFNDLTLIPASFVLSKGPNWPFRCCVAVDWVWCRSPFARWASAFTSVGFVE